MRIRIRRMMVIVGALALVLWLAIPAIRIGADSSARIHGHVLGVRHPSEPFRLNPRQALGRPGIGQTLLQFPKIAFEHPVSFWTRYRFALIGWDWPNGYHCSESAILARKYLELDPATEVLGTIRYMDRTPTPASDFFDLR